MSFLGVMMRYNIAFSLPGANHKYMQEAHSHFAFYGWVSACIYLFVVQYLSRQNPKINHTKYQLLMIFNQIGSYGMLVTFLYSGYYWLSIVFSSISLFTGFVYYIFLLIDTRKNKSSEIIWLRSGAFFAILSSLGVFSLAYMSASKNVIDDLYRACTYFYLHFQYNGFFLFSCVGLFLISLKNYKVIIPQKLNKNIFYLLFIGAFFGYGLSVLWIKMPDYLYGFFVAVSLIQLLGTWKLWKWAWNNKRKISESKNLVHKALLGIFGSAFLLKFILQSASAVPMLGIYAFNSINVAVAYLHLVLLVGISIFLLWKIIDIEKIIMNKMLIYSVYSIVLGILFNEILLALAGVFPIFRIPFLSSPYWLFFASLVIMISIVFFLKSLKFDYSNT
ncbi:hypothetical protein [Chryseobacterium oryctis]|uniref:Uncharacterized protein n=1 Tax=Chryseobacterium oryctis TaxID=2952618 RepID=A0ABT3HPE6_9FLAO|nr:hypothetical protein [Chryseobacterium oryctis]MCW3161624.1 hypothetical protein [Chryseobacterium oryctis]